MELRNCSVTAPRGPSAAVLEARARVLPDGPALSQRDFARLSDFIRQHFGIHLPPAKKVLLESRLRGHLHELGLSDFRAYCDRVLSGGSTDELVQMVDKITTNKTDFFREPQHFEVLVRTVLPALAAHGAGAQRELRVWSAACSTGEEPYTLAMVLSEVEQTPRLRFRIIGSDLSTRVLKHGRAALYRDEQVAPVPLALRRKYLLRSVTDTGLVRVGPALRGLVSFRRVNLLDRDYALGGPVDVVFCRNVFIYFERSTQRDILLRFAENLAPGGFLFLGHSETINGLDVPFDQIAPTVYRRRGAAPVAGRTP